MDEREKSLDILGARGFGILERSCSFAYKVL